MYIMLCFNKEHIWCSFESRSSLGHISYRTPVKFSVSFLCANVLCKYCKIILVCSLNAGTPLIWWLDLFVLSGISQAVITFQHWQAQHICHWCMNCFFSQLIIQLKHAHKVIKHCNKKLPLLFMVLFKKKEL